MEEDRIREIVREELATFNPPKKKRAPNKWQVFLKDCVKTQDNGLLYTEKVKACSVKYKENKNSNSNNHNSNNDSSENFSNQETEMERLAKLSNKKLSQMAK